MTKSILFISKDNLTTNPRLQKELFYAIKHGYDVSFLGFYSGSWSDEIDKQISKKIDADFKYISATRKPFFNWFLSSMLESLYKKLYFLFKLNLKINAFAHSKRSILLFKYLKRDKKKYNLIIAHTLPTLYPAYKFAKKNNIPFIFDIEDYHPGEIVSIDTKNEIDRRKFLFQKLLPKAACITYASPLIGKHSFDLLPANTIRKQALINNCFSQTEFEFNTNNSEKVQFVWFSQNIAHGRGLELILPALAKFKDKIQLTLIGNLYQNFYNDFLVQFSDFIEIKPPLAQIELNTSLSNYDIGLAIELISADFNRDICLTNKIFSYAQAGLYIFATDTSAQNLFMQENSELGCICEQSVSSFEIKIKSIIEEIEEIRKNKLNRFNYSMKFAFEKESLKLLEIWNDLM